MKTPFTIALCFFLSLTIGANAELSATDIEIARKALSSADAVVRRAGVRSLADGISRTLPPGRTIVKGSSGDELLPVLFDALKDQDEVVRADAAVALAILGTITMKAVQAHSINNPDIRKHPEAATALWKATNDVNEVVRKNSMDAYVSTFELTAELKMEWIKKFSSEPSKQIRNQILTYVLVGSAPSEEVVHFVVEQLKTSEFEYSAANALMHLSTPPQEALPILIEKLKRNDPDPGKREAWVRLLGSFGGTAKANLTFLQELEANESNPIVKRKLHSAIETIKSAAVP